jgi:hypothetical protein
MRGRGALTNAEAQRREGRFVGSAKRAPPGRSSATEISPADDHLGADALAQLAQERVFVRARAHDGVLDGDH